MCRKKIRDVFIIFSLVAIRSCVYTDTGEEGLLNWPSQKERIQCFSFRQNTITLGRCKCNLKTSNTLMLMRKKKGFPTLEFIFK